MKLLLIVAAGASLLLPLAIAPAMAGQSFSCTLCASSNPSSGGGDGGGKGYEAAEQLNPFKRGNDDGAGKLRDQFGKNPTGDPSLPGYVAGLPICKTELGDLRRVRAKAINAVDHGVSVTAICTNHNLMDQQDGIASIRSAIQDNNTMRKALRASGGYSANDVVAIVLDGEGAKLYVHRAHNAGL